MQLTNKIPHVSLASMTGIADQEPETAASVNLDRFEPPEFLLAKLNSRIRDMMNTALRAHGLKLVEWRALQCLNEGNHPLTVAELAELTVIDRTVASRLVDKMAARGFIKKETMTHDKRFSSITLTQSGRRRFEQCDGSTRAARNKLFKGISDNDLEDLQRLIHHLHANSLRTDWKSNQM